MDSAFDYIKANKGVELELYYPYQYMEEPCMYWEEKKGADFTGYIDLPGGDEQALKLAVATQGPISVVIDAGHQSFAVGGEDVSLEYSCLRSSCTNRECIMSRNVNQMCSTTLC